MENNKKYRLILASGSPRRKEILGNTGLEFEIKTSDKEEIINTTVPQDAVLALSAQKAEFVGEEVSGDVCIIGADTVVSYRNEILGKPKNKEDAIRMVSELAGDTHRVFTGVTILVKEDGKEVKRSSFYVETLVDVYSMSKKEIDEYVESGEPMDKAGAYAIQGLFAPYIKKIDGDYYNIVGFPISKIYHELKNLEIVK
ncbi:MAG: Maf family protein [Lachnospiraceae bacterium]|nr:Maf family protein [Lachnospiraceae bacterium]